jgi:NitT/TauT family transport system substrate-binding protein
MELFLKRDIDAAAAMTYNELAQVLETKNADTGQLHQLSELNVMKMSDLGTGALEDGVFVREDWINDENNQDIAKRFLKASFRGWVFCRDNAEECLQIVLKNGPTLGEGHQRWQLNEINKLIWPAPNGIGVMDPESFKVTNDIAVSGKVIKSPATDDAYRTDIAEDAVNDLEGDDVDVKGEDWKPQTVEVTEGGA